MGISSRSRGRAIKYTKSVEVILVDMQTSFVQELREGELDRIVPKQLATLKHCKQFGIPVVVLELDASYYGETIKVLIGEAKKNPYFRLIGKEFNSGFIGTDLDSHLKLLGAKKLFIMGINADFCVKKTADDAIKRGYEIITSNEVISGQYCHSKSNSVDWFKSNGHCIETIDEFPKIIS